MINLSCLVIDHPSVTAMITGHTINRNERLIESGVGTFPGYFSDVRLCGSLATLSMRLYLQPFA